MRTVLSGVLLLATAAGPVQAAPGAVQAAQEEAYRVELRIDGYLCGY